MSRDHELLATFARAISPLQPSVANRFGSIFGRRTVDKSQLFARQGALCLEVGFLLHGTLRAFFIREDGREYTKDFFVPLSFVAAPMSLFQRRPSSVSIVAEEDSVLLVTDADRLERLYDEHSELGRFGRKMVERAYSEREQKELELATLSGAERYRSFQERFPDLELRVPLYQVASYLSVTPTQLSRIRRSKKR